ncbi:serine hydrolase domain-containing protein [Fibrella forsythiae]|uniref:Serine hydrolase n=1 Tax=Fibrella forsythiae TaxID=2817061 RepID=A0ABS3JEH5_9BACT|nr:serine hydrolase [Fibrella forsythiae]MBO0948401.1 serine hydrolase [Fibrella forsythiae]
MKTTSLLLFLLLFVTNHLLSQSPDLVPTQGITSAIHQANIGQLRFTDKAMPSADLTEADFLGTYTLTNRSNLFMTAFMGNSLTNYLHQLAPELPADVLTKTGGYQFSFFVDDRLIYQSNLHPGAPYAQIKNTETIISKPLIDNQKEGAWWSQSAWNRFMNNGGDAALTEGPHRFRLDIRPYLNLASPTVGGLLASGTLKLLVNRKPVIDLRTIRLNVPRPYPGLPVSTERFDRDRIKALKGMIDAAVFKHITGVVVLKKGKLLIEEYGNGATRDSLHDVRSVGKSFASTLTGMAIQDGHLTSEQQSLADFYDLTTVANNVPAKARTTLRELLTMSSAFDGNDDDSDSPGNEENMYPTPNWVNFVLNLPTDSAKYRGSWHYFTAGVVLLGDVLNKVVPGGLARYADRKLLGPLGIRRYQWPYTPQQTVSMAGGVRMNALDFAKYGQLYKNGGRWNGRQLLPRAWVDKTFTRHKAIPGRPNEYYGYLFWNKIYRVNGKDYETYYATGNGGNKIFVFKDQPWVIVITATAYGTAYAHPQIDRMMEQYILPALLQ